MRVELIRNFAYITDENHIAELRFHNGPNNWIRSARRSLAYLPDDLRMLTDALGVKEHHYVRMPTNPSGMPRPTGPLGPIDNAHIILTILRQYQLYTNDKHLTALDLYINYDTHTPTTRARLTARHTLRKALAELGKSHLLPQATLLEDL